MPYINTTTTTKITEEKKQELTLALGEAIELIPGKTERWLMLNFVDEAKMAFAGDGVTDCAMIEVDALGRIGDDSARDLTAKLCETVARVLSIPQNRIYVKYSEYDKWGYDGVNF